MKIGLRTPLFIVFTAPTAAISSTPFAIAMIVDASDAARVIMFDAAYHGEVADLGASSQRQASYEVRPPNDATRAAKNRATQDKYFFIPPAKFRETYVADVPAPDAEYLADSQQQLPEKVLGAPVSATMVHQAQLRHPDHPGSRHKP
jgi:hypothetical protein